MILTKTPLRISFVGGGSDLQSFYRNNIGAVLSTSIDKYVYVAVNKKFDNSIRVSYSITEIVEQLQDLKHPLVKAVLDLFDIKNSIEVISLADVHSNGTGLGSSSSFTIGLTNAISTYLRQNISKEDLARIACNIEINICNSPIGKQDQYAAAYGGLNLIEFNPDESVNVTPVKISDLKVKSFQDSLLVLYTGKIRDASSVLSIQKDRNDKNFDNLKKIVQLAYNMKYELEDGALENIGYILDEGWHIKKNLAKNISNYEIDSLYNIGKKNGATGGKILGAGNGGFLLFFADKIYHDNITKKTGLKKLDIKFDKQGSIIQVKGDQ